MYKKNILLILMATVFAIVAQAQNNATAIKQRAVKMATALSSFKLDEYVTFLHPSLVNAQGGSVKIKQSQDSISKYQKMFGVKISKILIGEVSKTETMGKSLQAIFPMTTSIETPLGLMNAKTTVVAISEDKGKNWYFIDGLFYNNANIAAKLPKLSSKIIIPPTEKPSLQKPIN